MKIFDFFFLSSKEKISKPSAIVEKLLLDTKTKHNAVLEKFEKALEKLREACEEEIEHIKAEMQAEMDSIRCEIEKKKNDFCGVI